MRHGSILVGIFLVLSGSPDAGGASVPVWPPPPDAPRVEFLSEIDFDSLERQSGWWSRLARLIGGSDPDDTLGLPFDVLARGETLFLTCQNLAALVEVWPEEGKYRLHECDERPFAQPIALEAVGGNVYVTDSGNGTVYRFDGERVEPWVTEGLVRPTGIAAVDGSRRLSVVDTGAHDVKNYDLGGELLSTVGERAASDEGLNFPTFAASDGEVLLVNDTLNYRIKRFDRAGELHSAFGREGSGPGTFARPKGLALDSDGHVWVADAVFDNVQVFDSEGVILLVIGSRGGAPGEFWSPGGIDIADDTIYVADTFNNRVQVLRYLGGR